MVPTPLTSFQEIESEWEQVLSASPVNTVFLTPQWQEVWWDTFGNGKKMAGFYVEDPHGVAAIASLTRSGETLSFLGNPETVDYNDFMVRPGYESTFFDIFLGSLEQQDWDTVQLDSLVENSPTLTYLPDLARQRGYAVQVQQEDTSSGINLPDTWDEYLAGLSKKRPPRAAPQVPPTGVAARLAVVLPDRRRPGFGPAGRFFCIDATEQPGEGQVYDPPAGGVFPQYYTANVPNGAAAVVFPRGEPAAGGHKPLL